MRDWQNFRFWSSLVLASTHHFQLFKAVGIINLRGEIGQDQGVKLLNDDPGGLGSVSPSPVFESHSHTSNIRSQVGHGSKDDQARGMVSSLGQSSVADRKPVSPQKKLQIQSHLKQNEGELGELRIGYQSLLRSIKALRSKKQYLKQYCQVADRKTTSEVLAQLNLCYGTISMLKRDRFLELAGIGSAMTEMQPGPGPDALSATVTDKQKKKFGRIWSWWPQPEKVKEEPHQSGLVKANSERGPTSRLSRGRWGGMNKKTKEESLLVGKDSQDSQNPHQPAQTAQLAQNPPSKTESIAIKPDSEDGERTTFHSGEATNMPIFLHAVPQDRRLHDLVLAGVKGQYRLLLIQDLNKLLHSVSFPSLNQSLDKRNRIARIKVMFEKAIFQAIEYMYRNKLITEQEMQAFFMDEATLKRTGDHIHDLFPAGYEATSIYHPLVPEWSFMTTDWHTDHLHECLKKLEKKSQCLVTYTAVKAMIADDTLEAILFRSTDSISVTNAFVQDNFLKEFEKFEILKNDHSNSVSKMLTQAIRYFWLPAAEGDGQRTYIRSTTYGYWINYYILNFMHRFGNNDIQRSMKSSANFEKAYEMITQGYEMHQLVNRYIDYGYFLAYPQSLRYTIPQQVSKKGQQEIKHQYTELAQRILGLNLEIQEIAKNDQQVEIWMLGSDHVIQIINYYTCLAGDLDGYPKRVNQNLWQMERRSNEDFEAKGYNNRRKTLEHLAMYYSLPRLLVLHGIFGTEQFQTGKSFKEALSRLISYYQKFESDLVESFIML